MRNAFSSILVALVALPASLVGCADKGSSIGGGACALVDSTTDLGDVAAFQSQRCNVPMSMGSKHWYRISTTMFDDVAPMIVQLELWDDRGPFAGDSVQPGSYTIGGLDADPTTCGVCLRAVVDKGMPTEREYFATGGKVDVTAVSADEAAPFSATLTDATFDEIGSDKTFVDDGCTSSLARVKMSGAVEIKGGTGGMTGGGGTGCKFTIAD